MQKSNFCDYLIEVPLAINFLHYFSTKYRNFPLSGNSAHGPPLPLAYKAMLERESLVGVTHTPTLPLPFLIPRKEKGKRNAEKEKEEERREERTL